VEQRETQPWGEVSPIFLILFVVFWLFGSISCLLCCNLLLSYGVCFLNLYSSDSRELFPLLFKFISILENEFLDMIYFRVDVITVDLKLDDCFNWFYFVHCKSVFALCLMVCSNLSFSVLIFILNICYSVQNYNLIIEWAGPSAVIFLVVNLLVLILNMIYDLLFGIAITIYCFEMNCSRFHVWLMWL